MKTKDCLKYKSFEGGGHIWFHLLNECFCFFSLIWRGDSVRSVQQHSSSPVSLFHRLQQYKTPTGTRDISRYQQQFLLCLNVSYLTFLLYFTGTSRSAWRGRTTWAHGSARPSRTQRAVDSRRSCKCINTPDTNTHTLCDAFSAAKHKSSAHQSGDYLAIYYEGNLQAGEYLWHRFTFLHVWEKDVLPKRPKISISVNS